MSESLQPHGLHSPWNSPVQNTGVGTLPFSRVSSQPRDRIQVSCIAGRFFTVWATGENYLIPESLLLGENSCPSLSTKPTYSNVAIFLKPVNWLRASFIMEIHMDQQEILAFSLLFKKKFIFYWRIIALQNFVFYQTSTWISHRYTYIPSLLSLSPISLPIPPL